MKITEKHAGAIPLALGIFGLLAWATGSDFLATLLPDAHLLGLNTPLLFAILGAGFLLHDNKARVPRLAVDTGIGVVMVLSALVLLESMFDVPLGIDLPGRTIAPQPEIPHPGRISPNACVAFFLAGLSMLLSRLRWRSEWRSRLQTALAGVVALIGAAALVGHASHLPLFYRVADFNRMLLPTAIGLVFAGIALLRMPHRALPLAALSPAHHEARLYRSAVGILATMAILGGVIGFAILREGLEQSIKDNLLLTTRSNAAQISYTLKQQVMLGDPDNRIALRNNIVKMAERPGDAALKGTVDASFANLVKRGWYGVQVRDDAGKVLTGAGEISDTAPTFKASLSRELIAYLFWRDGYRIHVEKTFGYGNGRLGTMVSEQPVTVLGNLAFDLATKSSSTELLICSRNSDSVECAPSRLRSAVQRFPLRPAEGSSSQAAAQAVLGETGVRTLIDAQGVSVFAAYAPIPDTGLAMVLKVDTGQLYEPLRQRLPSLAMVIVYLIFAGILLLRLEIKPLIRRITEGDKRLRMVADSVPALIGYVDKDGRFEFGNRRYQDFFGVSQDALPGRHVEDVIGPEAYAVSKAGLQQALAGKVARFERVVHRQGGPRWDLVNYIPEIRPDGSVAGAIVLVEDVTSLKKIQAEVAASERRIRTITDNIPALITYFDAGQHYRFCNNRYQQIINRPADALIGMTVRDVIGEHDYRSLVHHIEAALRGRPVSFERHIPFRGTMQTYQFDYIPDRLPDGEVVGVYAMAVDVTARKQMERALMSEKERLRITLESISDAVIATDAAGSVTYLNPSAEDMTGWRAEEALGLALSTVFNIEDIATGQPVMNPVEMVLRRGSATGGGRNAKLVKRDGVRYPIEESAAPIRDAAGTVTGVVLVFRDVSEAQKMADRMTYQAIHDPLTGLINRREFESRLDKAIATLAPSGNDHTMLYLDLDQFKIVNDTCGHTAGDALLRQLTTVLNEKLRKSDTLARLGGDEFGVLLLDCTAPPAVRIAEELRKTVSDFRFFWEEKLFTIGVSIGLVTFGEGMVRSDILRWADTACYVAKENGRNRIHIYKHDDKELALRHGEMDWVSRIKSALEENRFVLYSQPISALGSADGPAQAQHLRRHELLLRMKSENGDIIAPMAFIPAAERYGLMPALDRWVVEAAFSRHIGKNAPVPIEGNCAINLSGATLGDPDFLAFVLEMRQRYEVDAASVCFEITETAAIASLDLAMGLIRALKASGFKFALDDFGSGMSSFGYLKHLPVDYLKIDGRFVKDIVDNPIDYAMVEAINKIGHVMGLHTIAEFVENDAIIAVLRQLGVDYAQGYGIGRPEPREMPATAASMIAVQQVAPA